MNTFFVDADDMDFDGEDFLGLGKKARAKRRRKKQLRSQGLSRKEARKQARKELKTGVIKPIKRKEELVVSLPKPIRAKAEKVVRNLKNAGVPNVAIRTRNGEPEVIGVTDAGYEVDVTESGLVRPTTRMAEGDFEAGASDGKKTNWMLIGGIALVVAVGGYFVLRK